MHEGWTTIWNKGSEDSGAGVPQSSSLKKKKVTFIFNYVSASVWSVHMRAGARGGLRLGLEPQSSVQTVDAPNP